MPPFPSGFESIKEPVMSRYASIPSRTMLVLFPFLAGFFLPAAAATDARVSESYGKLPLHFEANRGQTDKNVRFLSRDSPRSEGAACRSSRLRERPWLR